MSSVRRMFGISGFSFSEKGKGDPPADRQDNQLLQKPKLSRLTSLIFCTDKRKPTITSRRAANSMDVLHNDVFERCPATLTSTGRQSESRLLASHGSGDCSSQEFQGRNSGPRFQASDTQHLISCDEVSLCAVAISAPTTVTMAPASLPKSAPPAEAAGALGTAESPGAHPSASSPNPCPLSSSAAASDGSGTSDSNTQNHTASERKDTASVAACTPPVTLRAAAAGMAARPASPTLRFSPSQQQAASAACGSNASDLLPTRLLAVCPGAPAGMQRPCWALRDYCVERRLFKSPSSSVYTAVCLHSGMPVALKVYNMYKVPVNVLHTLWREIIIQSALVHKNIVMLYGAFQDVLAHPHRPVLVLVLQLAANGHLHELHRSLGCHMSEDQARVLVLQPLLEAMVHIHACGVVHRDIKPDNILFTSDWRLVLADFGVAINLFTERAVTRAGTVGYMAPEVERCPMKSRAEDNKDNAELSYTATADVWAVGCLAYQLLVGFPPFLGGTSCTLSFPASTSTDARDFIRAALSECPADRPTALQLMGHPWMGHPWMDHP